LFSDFTRNLAVVGRQPYTDPTSCRTCRRGALIALLWRFRVPPEVSASLLFCCFGCGFLLAFALSLSLPFYFA